MIVNQPTARTDANAAAIFKAMADPTRQKILQVLIQEELDVSELVAVLQLPQSTVSRHLKTLWQARLVVPRQHGTATAYAPNRSPGDLDADDLAGQMLQWAAAQPLSARLAVRLDTIVRGRQNRSDRFFAGMVDRWDQLRTDCFGHAFHLEALTALLPADWIVVDVGTGTGYLLPTLARTFARVIAVDPVSEMLAAARARAGAARLDNVSFRAGSAGALPLDDAEVDLCIASLVLHHDPDPGHALAELYRVLRPGGRLLLVEQCAHQLAPFRELMQDHWWGFEPATVAEWARLAGFDTLRTRPLRTAAPDNRRAPEAPRVVLPHGR